MRAHFPTVHSAEGLADLRRRLARFGPPAELRVALERPSGVLVDTLVEAGYRVVSIHPNVVKAARSRAAPGKRDPGDAYLLADLLRTDGHRFRPLRPLSDETRALLEQVWPGAAAIFADVVGVVPAVSRLGRGIQPASYAPPGGRPAAIPRAAEGHGPGGR